MAIYKIDDEGREIPDPKPMDIPIGFKKPESLADAVRRLVTTPGFIDEMKPGEDAETFEEADDFEVGDDFDPSSPYEQVFDPILQKDVSPQEYHDNQAAYREQYMAQHLAENPPPPTEAEPPETETAATSSTQTAENPEK